MGEDFGYCSDCGQPAVGSYQFYYPNPGAQPSWSPSRPVCLKHKKIREQNGHKSRAPVEDESDNAPDPVPAVGTQAPDYDQKLADQAAEAAAAAKTAGAAPARPKVVVEPLE